MQAKLLAISILCWAIPSTSNQYQNLLALQEGIQKELQKYIDALRFLHEMEENPAEDTAIGREVLQHRDTPEETLLFPHYLPPVPSAETIQELAKIIEKFAEYAQVMERCLTDNNPELTTTWSEFLIQVGKYAIAKDQDKLLHEAMQRLGVVCDTPSYKTVASILLERVFFQPFSQERQQSYARFLLQEGAALPANNQHAKTLFPLLDTLLQEECRIGDRLAQRKIYYWASQALARANSLSLATMRQTVSDFLNQHQTALMNWQRLQQLRASKLSEQPQIAQLPNGVLYNWPSRCSVQELYARNGNELYSEQEVLYIQAQKQGYLGLELKNVLGENPAPDAVRQELDKLYESTVTTTDAAFLFCMLLQKNKGILANFEAHKEHYMQQAQASCENELQPDQPLYSIPQIIQIVDTLLQQVTLPAVTLLF